MLQEERQADGRHTYAAPLIPLAIDVHPPAGDRLCQEDLGMCLQVHLGRLDLRQVIIVGPGEVHSTPRATCMCQDSSKVPLTQVHIRSILCISHIPLQHQYINTTVLMCATIYDVQTLTLYLLAYTSEVFIPRPEKSIIYSGRKGPCHYLMFALTRSKSWARVSFSFGNKFRWLGSVTRLHGTMPGFLTDELKDLLQLATSAAHPVSMIPGCQSDRYLLGIYRLPTLSRGQRL